MTRKRRRLMKRKDPNNVRGNRIQCLNFDMCPLCYGCRAFNPRFIECHRCKEENQKYNICNTTKHRPDLLAKMIKKERIEIS